MGIPVHPGGFQNEQNVVLKVFIISPNMFSPDNVLSKQKDVVF